MAAKPFSDRVIPELSNIPLSDGMNSFMASVQLECQNPCRGQVNAVIDGETHLSTGFEIAGVQGWSTEVVLQGTMEAECITIEVDCSETVLVTANMHISGSGQPERFRQDTPVLVGRDLSLCEIDRCKIPAMAGRPLCSRHAYPGEVVKSDRRRAIEATLAKRAKVSGKDGR